MKVVIRPETLDDFADVARVHFAAFTGNNYICEPLLVDFHRRGRGYDPDLSLVAEVEGEIVGHVLFYGYLVQVGDAILPAVCLAPIAVLPEFQGEGIGAKLIEEGHRRARDKGYKFAFLLGHPRYYPQFGYQMGMFGECFLEVSASYFLPQQDLDELELVPEMAPVLKGIWQDFHQGAELAIVPGSELQDWKPHAPGSVARAFGRQGQVMGYMRYNKASGDMKEFAAREARVAEHMLATWYKEYARSCKLPVHPDSRGYNYMTGTPVHGRWGAAMILILDQNCGEIVRYCRNTGGDGGIPGLMNWPALYDIAE